MARTTPRKTNKTSKKTTRRTTAAKTAARKDTTRTGHPHRLVVLGKGHAALADAYTTVRPELLRSLRTDTTASTAFGKETPIAAEHIIGALEALPPRLRALFPYTSEELRQGKSEVDVLSKIVTFGETLVGDAAQALAGAKARLGDKTGDFLGRVETLSDTLLSEGDANVLHTACVPLFGLARERRLGIRTTRNSNDKLRSATEEERQRREAAEAENHLLRAGATPVTLPAPVAAPRRSRRR